MRNCAPDTLHTCSEKRWIPLPSGPGRSSCVPVYSMARLKMSMMVCLAGCDPSGSGMKGTVSDLGNRVRTRFSCRIIAQCGQIGFVWLRSHTQLWPRLTHMPVVSFFWIGNVK